MSDRYEKYRVVSPASKLSSLESELKNAEAIYYNRISFEIGYGVKKRFRKVNGLTIQKIIKDHCS
jgi:hypothetical protein